MNLPKNGQLNKIATVFMGLTALLALFIFHMAFWPVKVMAPNVQPYKMITTTVKPGEVAVYEVDACKFIDATGIVQRKIIVGDVNYILTEQPGSVQKGCGKSRVPITIPPNIPTGRAYFKIDITYKINALRDQTYHFTTESFEIK